MRYKTLCRRYYGYRLKGRSNYKCNNKCRLYHPDTITPNDTQEYNRELGQCYCGSYLKTLLIDKSNDMEKPLFIVICGRTWKGISRCKNAT